jgi:dTDP-4-amino-4,6-dideoxygalactose transaminase
MSQARVVQDKLITLPSDHEASGRMLGVEEIAALATAIGAGTLTSTKREFVRSFEKEFAKTLGVKHAYACASGTAAMHLAVAAIDPEPGDEIVTSPITDMGALTPILYQGAIPVFADVDPRTCNVTAETISPKLGPKTRAIVITHLFGNPCEINAILELARDRKIPVIEDCAQALGTTYAGRPAGTFGTIASFSLAQGSHITTGEGGIVVTDDEALARRVFLSINKAWGYGDQNPDHYFLALNYRMSELQGAVAVAQLPKLSAVVVQRIAAAKRLTGRLQGITGIETPFVARGAVHSYWKYGLMVDRRLIEGGSPALGRLLKERGIASAPRYIQKPAFMCEIFQKQKTFGESRWPFSLAHPEAVNYGAAKFTGAFNALERILVLPWNERYTDEHVDFIAESIRDAVRRLAVERIG